MDPRFHPLDDRPGLAIVDPIESRRFVLHTPTEVAPIPTDTDEFQYPVSAARRVVTSAISLPHTVPVAIRDASDGSHILDVGHAGSRNLDTDDYLLELSAPLKIYVRVESSLDIDANTEGVRLGFGGPTRATVGARLLHTLPAATVTVPDDPVAAMEAVTAFGSALKTTSCERAWPTLRGHPPRIERGDELAIPDGLDRPDTGVEIAVPPEWKSLYPVAPLAYYLGAEVVPGETPELTTDAGFTHRLDTRRGFESEVSRVLKQVFVFDCVTRTEGFHPMNLHERNSLDARPNVDLDFGDLYDRTLADQLQAYLSVPYEAVEDLIGTWQRATHVRPDADTLELLPYVANDLSLVRVKTPASPSSTGSATDENREARDALSSFKRRTRPEDGDGVSPFGDGPRGVPDSGEYVPLPDDDAFERAWVGDGTPVHGAKLLGAAFDHDRTEPTDGVIDVTVVCNDDQMREEWDAVSAVYGNRDLVPFDVECRFDVPTDDLRELLAEDTDLFHYVGHIDGRGFACPDGILDAETLETTGATTILLNACRSHDQGVALVEAGARAAIVSWGDVDNLGAIEVGETFARLLNYGFGVGSALEIVEEHTAIGRHYVVVGDPGVTLAQCEDGNPLLYEFDRETTDPPAPGENVSVRVSGYGTRDRPVGSASHLYFDQSSDPTFHLVPGELDRFTATGATLVELVGDYPVPVVVDGELLWTERWFGQKASSE